MICSGLSQNTCGVLDMKSSAALRAKLTGTAPNVLRFRFLQKIHQDNTCPPLLLIKNHYTSYICVSLPFLKKESQCHCMRSFDVLKKANMRSTYVCSPHPSYYHIPKILILWTLPNHVQSPSVALSTKQKRTPVMLPSFLPQCNNTHKYDFVLF
jgi:hypothetical protein